MIGSEPPAIVHRDQPAGEVRLSVRRLALPKAHPFATELIDVDFELRAGEILGVAGVSGNGQQELLGVLSGEDNRADANAVMLEDLPIRSEEHTSELQSLMRNS